MSYFVKLAEEWAFSGMVFHIADKSNGKTYQLIYGEPQIVEVGLGVDVKPSLIVPHGWEQGFCQGMTQALAEKGFFPQVTEEVKGRLEATEKHLQDMRTLVFKGKQS